MKLTTLLEQCESNNATACLLAKQRLRRHAAEVLPELVRRLRFVIHNGTVMSNLELVELVSEALLVAEEVQT